MVKNVEKSIAYETLRIDDELVGDTVVKELFVSLGAFVVGKDTFNDG
jgi:hypothetical protein